MEILIPLCALAVFIFFGVTNIMERRRRLELKRFADRPENKRASDVMDWTPGEPRIWRK